MWSLVYFISFANRINARENKDFDLLKWIVNCQKKISIVRVEDRPPLFLSNMLVHLPS